jgi:hypothetical protein
MKHRFGRIFERIITKKIFFVNFSFLFFRAFLFGLSENTIYSIKFEVFIIERKNLFLEHILSYQNIPIGFAQILKLVYLVSEENHPKNATEREQTRQNVIPVNLKEFVIHVRCFSLHQIVSYIAQT